MTWSTPESESYQGIAVVKVFFQPQVQIAVAQAQVTSIVQTILRVLPPGSFPPFIIKYDASSVPILQLALSGQGLSEADLYDDGLQFIRPRLANVKGASVPLPLGGKVKQVMVDTDPNLMYAHHLSASDVSTAVQPAEPYSARRNGAHGRQRIHRADEFESP